MRFSESEIIEDMLAHIRQCGGDFAEWCVGTAQQGLGARGSGLGKDESGRGVRDLGPGKDGVAQPTVATATTVDTNSTHLIYREAYTKYAAAEIVERLKDFGIRLATGTRDSGPGARGRTTPAGDMVFVYRTHAAETTCHSARP